MGAKGGAAGVSLKIAAAVRDMESLRETVRRGVPIEGNKAGHETWPGDEVLRACQVRRASRRFRQRGMRHAEVERCGCGASAAPATVRPRPAARRGRSGCPSASVP